MPEKIIEQRAQERLEESNIPPSIYQIIRLMATDFASLKTAFETHMKVEESQRQEVNGLIEKVSDELKVLSTKIDDALVLKQAFPHVEGKPDVHGHRTDHESRMEEAEKSNRLWAKVKEEVVTNAVRGVMIALVVIIGLGLRDWVAAFLKSAAPVPEVTISAPQHEGRAP